MTCNRPPPFYGAITSSLGPEVDLCVTGVPFDHGVSRQRPFSLGPLTIRRQSARLALGCRSLYPWPAALHPSRVADVGDFSFDPELAIEELLELLRQHFGRILDARASPLMLGGVHTLSLAAIEACARRFGPLSLLQFDAHQDSSGQGGASPHNGNWARLAAARGWIDPGRSVQVFLRTAPDDPDGQQLGFHRIWASEAVAATADELAAAIRESLGPAPVYLTFDLDAVDPAFAPGTGNPVFGGPTARQVLDLLFALRGLEVVGADVMELSSDQDVRELTALLAAQVGASLLHLLGEAQGLKREKLQAQ